MGRHSPDAAQARETNARQPRAAGRNPPPLQVLEPRRNALATSQLPVIQDALRCAICGAGLVSSEAGMPGALTAPGIGQRWWTPCERGWVNQQSLKRTPAAAPAIKPEIVLCQFSPDSAVW
jgi:hypothetical protein